MHTGAPITVVQPGTFDADAHYYPRVPNTPLHPLVSGFLHLGNKRIATRYCHLHPEVDPQAVTDVLEAAPRFFRWAGADIFHVTNEAGVRKNVLIETNSSPSGQKSMPLRADWDEQGGYRVLLERSFLPRMKARGLPTGSVAVLCDKNPTETTGYAHVLADLLKEPVYWVHFPSEGTAEYARFDAGVLHIKHDGEWIPIRAAFRYVTQSPWDRIPPITRTLMFNPIVVCLAGGRNKLLAAKAYDWFNAKMESTGLMLQVPETIWDVTAAEVPMWVERMGGVAVVKNPYSNAGQGVYTITSPKELAAFMAVEQRYDRFIVQGLIGNLRWTSRTRSGRLFHVGTVPNKDNQIYVADFRFMVGASDDGFFPVALYARRARKPLVDDLTPDMDSWSMLGTNLSVQQADGWTTEPKRLMLMDNRDFNRLGLGLDDLCEAYLQTCMSVIAIDDMANRLVTARGKFRSRLFASLVPDPRLTQEIIE